MNSKAVLFVSDLVIALSVAVLFLGTMYVMYFNYSNDYANQKEMNKLETSVNIILNNLAVGPRNCNMVSESGSFVKKIAFCFDSHSQFTKSDLNLGDTNYTITCPNETNKNCLNTSPFIDSAQINSKTYLSKDINIWVADSNISRTTYLNCIRGTCNLSKMVRVYVWSN